jgi:hypothetical protein
MSSLTPAQFLFLYRQQQLITFGLLNVFYGVCQWFIDSFETNASSPGVYVALVALLVYFFCECLGQARARNHHLIWQWQLGINVKKQTSYKVLMGLIVLMLFLQTVHNIGTWYISWLGFIYYGDAPAQALDALEVDGTTSLSLRIISSILYLLTTLRLSIADSIMVSARPSLPTKTAC